MRSIRKGDEPKSLTEHRSSNHADYENYADKEAFRIPGKRGMKIEHWRSQREYPEDQLDFSNLLGACIGNDGQSRQFQHCDTRKGSSKLTRNPANPAHKVDVLMEYRGDGRISSSDVEFDREINEVLNLNEARLRNNRKATLDAFLKQLQNPGRSRRQSCRNC